MLCSCDLNATLRDIGLADLANFWLVSRAALSIGMLFQHVRTTGSHWHRDEVATRLYWLHFLVGQQMLALFEWWPWFYVETLLSCAGVFSSNIGTFTYEVESAPMDLFICCCWILLHEIAFFSWHVTAVDVAARFASSLLWHGWWHLLLSVCTVCHHLHSHGQDNDMNDVNDMIVVWWVMGDGWWVMGDGWWVMGDGWWVMGDGWWVMGDGWWVMGDIHSRRQKDQHIHFRYGIPPIYSTSPHTKKTQWTSVLMKAVAISQEMPLLAHPICCHVTPCSNTVFLFH